MTGLEYKETGMLTDPQIPRHATAAVVLADGLVFWGQGLGAATKKVGEICFNTSMTGYQESLTDPSYAGQIITFTFPHIGNVGVNDEDLDPTRPMFQDVSCGPKRRTQQIFVPFTRLMHG